MGAILTTIEKICLIQFVKQISENMDVAIVEGDEQWIVRIVLVEVRLKEPFNACNTCIPKF